MKMKSIAFVVTMLSLPLIAGSDATEPDGTPVDLRVEGFIGSKWGQTTINGADDGKICYNYYVEEAFRGLVNYDVNKDTHEIIPDGKPVLYCGCVSTALGMVMKYWEYPKNEVSFESYTNVYSYYEDGFAKDVELECHPKGGKYDWDAMPNSTMDGATDEQREAIGKLMYDIAITSKSTFSPTGTFATAISAKRALETFGYACECVIFNDGNAPYSDETLEKIVVPCIDAHSPVVLTVAEAGKVASHAIIVDGYGYDSEGWFMVHVICGNWGENDDWYYPGEGFKIGGKDFVSIRECLYNILPGKSGTIVSGRVLDVSGIAVSGATVKLCQGKVAKKEATTDAKGIFAFLADAGTYSIEASLNKKVVRIDNVIVATNASPQIIERYEDRYWNDANHEPVISNLHGIDLWLPGDKQDTVDDPVIDGGASFTNSTEVSISCKTDTAVIYYTTDGSMPDKYSKLYTAPFTIHDTITVKAIAYAREMNASKVVTKTFTNMAKCPGDDFDHPLLLQGASGTRTITGYADYTRDWEKDPIVDCKLDYMEWRDDTGAVTNSWVYEYHTIWFEWTAPGSGNVSFMVESSDRAYNNVKWYDFDKKEWSENLGYWRLQYGAISAIYTGDDYSSLQEIVSGGSTGSEGVNEKGDPVIHINYANMITNTFDAVEGQTYRILCACPNVIGEDWYGAYWDGVSYVSKMEDGTLIREEAYKYTDRADAYLQITWNGNLKKESAKDQYVIQLRDQDDKTVLTNMTVDCEAVVSLPRYEQLTKRNKPANFLGWRSSNKKLYDDGIMVFDLEWPGVTNVMTATVGERK